MFLWYRTSTGMRYNFVAVVEILHVFIYLTDTGFIHWIVSSMEAENTSVLCFTVAIPAPNTMHGT